MKILVSDKLSNQGVEKLKECADVDVKTGLSPEELISVIGEYDGLVIRSGTTVTAEVIKAAKNLKVIGRAGVGVDNIDVPEATKHGIIVVNAPEGNTITTAEHTIAMMMSLARNIPQAYLKLKGKKWDRKSFVGVEFNGKTLGVIGLGRIGEQVSRRAQGLNMKVVAYDPFITKKRAEELSIELGSFEDVIKQADFLTIHTPLTKETKHIVGAEQVSMMKDGIRIINCARGGVVDEEALIEGLRSGKVAGAALDVFEEEPPFDSPLLEMENVIAVPHLGASTVEAQLNVAIDVAEQVVNVLMDKPFKNAVNLPFLKTEVMNIIAPYMPLAENLGAMLSQISSGRMKEIKVSYSGTLAEQDVKALTASIVQGILNPILEEKVNMVNALSLAEDRGIEIVESKTSKSQKYNTLITLQLVTDQGTHGASGTLVNNCPRIVEIDKYFVDMEPSGYMLIIPHIDRPGIIGAVGTILGNSMINIASMQDGRKTAGGDAVMVVSVEGKVTDDVLEKIKEIDGIHGVSFVEL